MKIFGYSIVEQGPFVDKYEVYYANGDTIGVIKGIGEVPKEIEELHHFEDKHNAKLYYARFSYKLQ